MRINRMNRKTTIYIVIIVMIALMLYKVYGSMIRMDGFVDAGRCGVDLPSCPSGLRCINGYCKSDVAPRLPLFSDLPMMP
jgi:hypothetical protein